MAKFTQNIDDVLTSLGDSLEKQQNCLKGISLTSLNRIQKPFGIMSALKLKWGKKKKKIPDLYYNDDEDPEFMTRIDQEKANTLSDFFSSVYTNELEGTCELPNRPELRYKLKLSITTESLTKKLDKLKISKSSGPDGMHPGVLSPCLALIGHIPDICQDWLPASCLEGCQHFSHSQVGERTHCRKL